MAVEVAQCKVGLVNPHGKEKKLKPLLLSPAQIAEEKKRAKELTVVTLTSRETADLIMMGIGGLTPLDGFMGHDDWKGSCSDDMKLTDGTFWPIPVTMSVNQGKADSIKIGQEVLLVDKETEEMMGTMKVTEEIDALRTIGVGAQELLVLPKLLALIIALPLLTVFADVTGIFGGMIMASSKLDVSFNTFINRLDDAVSLSSFLVGLVKAPVFAAIIALVGCFQGFQVSGSADSVGRQTTVSVVQSIFLVILADALFSIVFNWFEL